VDRYGRAEGDRGEKKCKLRFVRCFLHCAAFRLPLLRRSSDSRVQSSSVHLLSCLRRRALASEWEWKKEKPSRLVDFALRRGRIHQLLVRAEAPALCQRYLYTNVRVSGTVQSTGRGKRTFSRMTFPSLYFCDESGETNWNGERAGTHPSGLRRLESGVGSGKTEIASKNTRKNAHISIQVPSSSRRRTRLCVENGRWRNGREDRRETHER
jgi:hypothetical protein